MLQNKVDVHYSHAKRIYVCMSLPPAVAMIHLPTLPFLSPLLSSLVGRRKRVQEKRHPLKRSKKLQPWTRAMAQLLPPPSSQPHLPPPLHHLSVTGIQEREGHRMHQRPGVVRIICVIRGTGDGGGTLEFLVTCITFFHSFLSTLPSPTLPFQPPSISFLSTPLIFSLEPQRPQYATHEEAKQAFRDLLKEKVLPFPLGRVFTIFTCTYKHLMQDRNTCWLAFFFIYVCVCVCVCVCVVRRGGEWSVQTIHMDVYVFCEHLETFVHTTHIVSLSYRKFHLTPRGTKP